MSGLVFHDPGKCPFLGVYPDMPEAEYRAAPAFNFSLLAKVNNPDYSLNHVHNYIKYGIKPTASMIMGTNFHKAVYGELQGEIDKVQPLPPEIKARRGAAYELLCKDNPDVTYLPKKEYQAHLDEYSTVLAMAESVTKNPTYITLCDGAKIEVSAFAILKFQGPQTLKIRKVVCKCRMDLYADGLIIDLKKTKGTSPRSFGRSVANFGYHIQAAMYTDIMQALTGEKHDFLFVACEDFQPYNVEFFDGLASSGPGGDALEAGRRAYQTAIDILLEAGEKDEWPGFANANDGPVSTFELPGWA